MPSKNMLPKGKRRHSVKAEYRATRTIFNEREAAAREAGILEEQPEPEPLYDTTPIEPIVAGYGLVTTGPNGGKHPKEFADHDKPRYAGLKVEPLAPEITVIEDLEPEDGVRTFTAEPNSAGLRLDAYLAKALPDISRARVQLLIEAGQVTVNGAPMKAKQKLRGGELIEIEGEPQPAPLRATPEDIPLAIVYEDADLAVIDKPAGMMVHAGAGDSESNRGTLVNALLHHMAKGLDAASEESSESTGGLSQIGGSLRPGIVHRLDKQTSGLIVVAKNDSTHRKLGDMFSNRRLRKVYLALVHGWIAKDEGTIALPISRDLVRRTRMTTRRTGGRAAVSHFTVLERIAGPFGKFTLVEVRIETGRTHQIRVHMQAIGHPVVGDTLYGAPRVVNPITQKLPGRASSAPQTDPQNPGFALDRNFLHAAELEFMHPRTNQRLELSAGLPPELTSLLHRVRGEDPNALDEAENFDPQDDD